MDELGEASRERANQSDLPFFLSSNDLSEKRGQKYGNHTDIYEKIIFELLHCFYIC